MGFKDLHIKLKAFRLRRFLVGNIGRRREPKIAKKASWMIPITHGYHVVEPHPSHSTKGSDDSDFDSVVVQREQKEGLELWFYGIFDYLVGDGIIKYMQSHFFFKELKESDVRRKSKEITKRAYLGARANIRETHKAEDTWRAGSASVMVINGEKLVMASMGDYRAVVCKDGVAHQTNSRHRKSSRRHWCRRLFSARILACDSGNAATATISKCSQLVVSTEKIGYDTEFVILASNGIWEVMKNQEAVSLIRHMDDPQEAAECLAKEALTRMSKGNISCLVIRFDWCVLN